MHICWIGDWVAVFRKGMGLETSLCEGEPWGMEGGLDALGCDADCVPWPWSLQPRGAGWQWHCLLCLTWRFVTKPALLHHLESQQLRMWEFTLGFCDCWV